MSPPISFNWFARPTQTEPKQIFCEHTASMSSSPRVGNNGKNQRISVTCQPYEPAAESAKPKPSSTQPVWAPSALWNGCSDSIATVERDCEWNILVYNYIYLISR